MKNTDRKLFLILALVLGTALLTLACALSVPAAQANPAAGTPGGSARGEAAGVSVSDGVILLTPGQPLPTLDLVQMGLTPAPTSANPAPNPDEEGLPTPEPTLDLKSLQLPTGMIIYPGATDLKASAVGGLGVKSLSFHTGDAIDKVMAYYNAQLTQAGWKILNGPANTPGPDGRQVWTWNNSTMSMVSIDASADPNGGTVVTVTWMSV
jgi:hypothetical protein